MPQVVQVCGTVIIDVLAFLFLLLGMLIASAWWFQNLASGIVNVPGGIHAAVVQHRDHVSLQIGNVVVQGSIVIERIRLSVIVIDKVHDVGYIIKICPGLAHHLTILSQIVVGNGAAGCRNCFAPTGYHKIVNMSGKPPMMVFLSRPPLFA